MPKVNVAKAPPPGTKQKLDELGAEGFAKWMLAQERVLITDTTMRDAHQSLLATRMRQPDMTAIAPYYAHLMPQLFSMECWGGATFDVAMRFLREDPWSRLEQFRAAHAESAPADAAAFVERGGLHQLPGQRGAGVRRSRRRSRASTCSACSTRSTGSRTCASPSTRCSRPASCAKRPSATRAIFRRPKRPSTRSTTTSKMGRELKAAGTHILGIKDMAGLCQPSAAYTLVKALKDELKIPVHFHTHDTSGIAAASVLAAVAAGVRCGRWRGGRHERAHLAAQPRLHRRSAALRRRATPASIRPTCAPSPCTGSRCARTTSRSRATSAPAPPRCTCTACPAGNTPTSRSRRARSASTIRAGPRCRRPMPM